MKQFLMVASVLMSLLALFACDNGSAKKTDLAKMHMRVDASVNLDDPRGGGTVNCISAPNLNPGGFICDVGPHYKESQAMRINLAFPYEGGEVTKTQTGLPLLASPVPGITDIEVPLDGEKTKLSYRLSAMPAQGKDKEFILYFYPSFPMPEGKATGW